MEYKRQLSGRWIQKTVIFLVFGLFTATAQAQVLGLLPPTITVQPVGTSVQNGDSFTFATSAYCTLGNISTVTWFLNGKSIPTTNTTVVNHGLLSTTVSSTLTVNHVSSGCVGTYSVQITDQLLGGLLGLLTATATSQNATLGIIPTVTGTTAGSGMVAKGFKVQFLAPVGSNVVIQASSDLNGWTSICTNVATDGSVTYTDAVAKTSSCRFYRGVLK